MPARHSYLAIAAAAVLVLASTVLAQVSGVSRGFSGGGGGSYEVGGVEVDVTARTAEAARDGGWRIAQRKGWAMLAKRLGAGGGSLSDGALESVVTGIVVENEEIGPNRYIARLGVMFDRGKAAAILGVGGQRQRSLPMLVVPIEWSGGAPQGFEQKTAWDAAWARFRTGNSSVDYVRATGTSADALLLNYAQTGRRGRAWWRTILDQYGAADVLVPEVRLYRQWPGGPIIGVFTVRHGPDGVLLGRYTLRVGSRGALDALLDAGIRRIDEAYQAALAGGMLKLDPGLAYRPPAAEATDDATDDEQTVESNSQDVPAAPQGATVNVQFDTADASAVAAAEAALRGVPGVKSANTTSLALGGVSVMRVVFDGDSAALRAALDARGWQVQEASGTLRIRRAAQPAPAAPAAGGAPPG